MLQYNTSKSTPALAGPEMKRVSFYAGCSQFAISLWIPLACLPIASNRAWLRFSEMLLKLRLLLLRLALHKTAEQKKLIDKSMGTV